MRLQNEPIPRNIENSLADLKKQLVEYLELEGNQSLASEDLSLAGYFIADSAAGFLVFEYASDEGPAIAFAQHALHEPINDGCMVCWPRTEGRTIEWSVSEYLDYNPLD